MGHSRVALSAIFLQAFLCIGGLSGAIPMLLHPDDSPLGMSLNMLEHSPVDTYFWPGIFLLIVMSFWPAVNVYGLLKRTGWAPSSTYILGIVTIVWIIYETITIRTFSPLQPMILLVGCALAFAGKRMMKRNEGSSRET